MKPQFSFLIGLGLLSACAPSMLPSPSANVSQPTLQPTEGSTRPAATSIPTESPTAAHLGTPWADYSLTFDPQRWQRAAFDPVFPSLEMLINSEIEGCRVTPNIPVGLSDNWSIERSQTALGRLTLTVRRFYRDGDLQFVAYYGFLGDLHNGGLEVHFEESAEACIGAAEGLIASAELILPTATP